MVEIQLPYAPRQFDPVEARHVVIGDQDLRPGLGNEVQRGPAIFRGEGAIAKTLDDPRKEGALDQVVFGYDYVKRLGHARSTIACRMRQMLVGGKAAVEKVQEIAVARGFLNKMCISNAVCRGLVPVSPRFLARLTMGKSTVAIQKP